MPEHIKVSLGASSPVARSGGGDISERELSRERNNLQSTPPARLQPVHRKKQLFFTPVNKFTASSTSRSASSTNLTRIRSCLEDYRRPPRTVKVAPKALSMEDLTPTKRVKKEKKCVADTALVPSTPDARAAPQQQAAARIGRFMLLHAWRRRRDEVRCLRKTLTFQVSCSERLRIQVSTLKSLLDSDNVKLRLAMRELERLKLLLRERDLEKQVLEREKLALENDVAAAEDKASEMSIGWRNTRNELECTRNAMMNCEHQLTIERETVEELRAEREEAIERLTKLEEQIEHHEVLLTSAEDEVSKLKREMEDKMKLIDKLKKMLKYEKQSLEAKGREVTSLEQRLISAEEEKDNLRRSLAVLQGECARIATELAVTRRQLDWWPRPLTRLLGAVRCWLRRPLSPDALLWAMVPARHGCW